MSRATDRERPSTDEIHRVLANARRRRTLRCLERVAESVSLDRLARHVSTMEGPVGDDHRPEQGSVRVALHHAHLPLLADVGLIEYDAETERIHPGPFPPQITDALDRERRSSR